MRPYRRDAVGRHRRLRRVVAARPADGRRLLVVLERSALREAHSLAVECARDVPEAAVAVDVLVVPHRLVEQLPEVAVGHVLPWDAERPLAQKPPLVAASLPDVLGDPAHNPGVVRRNHQLVKPFFLPLRVLECGQHAAQRRTPLVRVLQPAGALEPP